MRGEPRHYFLQALLHACSGALGQLHTWLRTSACFPACRRTPIASYMTMQLNAKDTAKIGLPNPWLSARAVVTPCTDTRTMRTGRKSAMLQDPAVCWAPGHCNACLCRLRACILTEQRDECEEGVPPGDTRALMSHTPFLNLWVKICRPGQPVRVDVSSCPVQRNLTQAPACCAPGLRETLLQSAHLAELS